MKNILVVDDEPLVVTLVGQILVEADFNVLRACSGEEAVQVASEFPGTLDLLLTDLNMPGIDGYGLTARLREQQPGLKVIHMSGFYSQTAAESMEPQPCRFLQKPFGVANLLAAIAAVVSAASPY